MMGKRDFDAEAQVRQEQQRRQEQADRRMEQDPAMGALIEQRRKARERQDADRERAEAMLETIRQGRG